MKETSIRKKLEEILYKHIPSQELSDDEKYLYLISIIACSFAMSMQLLLWVFYLFAGISPLVNIYFSGLLFLVLLVWLVLKHRYQLFGLLLSGIVIIETLVSAVFIGTNNFVIVYLFVALMMQMIIPYTSVRIRTFVVILLGISMYILVIINHNMIPTWNLGEANTTLAFFYINIAFFGTIIQLTVGNFIRDVIVKANRKKLEESKNEANTDPLTGLFNRRYANAFFKQLSINKVEQDWCVSMMDIDDFKVLNDTYGHKVGDEVLIFISDFIRKNLRKRDLVFRWGGEEFLILLKDVEVPIAFRILDKLRSRLELENIETHDKILNVTVTIGVCSLDIQHVEQSIDTSDQLMYKGKALGKNMVVM